MKQVLIELGSTVYSEALVLSFVHLCWKTEFSCSTLALHETRGITFRMLKNRKGNATVPKLSVVIPTLNGEKELPNLLKQLENQTRFADEIVIVDSASDDHTCEIAASYPGVRIIDIERNSFNHGLTRDLALRESIGDYVAFLTQDAVPANDFYLEKLTELLDLDPQIALVSGRQLPKEDARRFERLVRDYNYPNQSNVRTLNDLSRLGIKTYFASDVCSCYRRSTYFEVGGFEKVNTNEDMLMAARLLKAGYKIAYDADAKVVHSHNLTPIQQFKRNREVGEFLAKYNAELNVPDEIGEGSRLVKDVFTSLLREGDYSEVFAFIFDCAARLIGNRVGRLSSHRKAHNDN